MGRKKGKQSHGFKSKAQRGAWYRTEIDQGKSNDSSNSGYVSQTGYSFASVSDERRSIEFNSWLTHRRKEEATRRGQLSGRKARESAESTSWHDGRPAYTYQPLTLANASLAELAAQSLAQVMACLEADEFTDYFYHLPGRLVSVMSRQASADNQINTSNVSLLMVPEVKSLVIYGDVKGEALNLMRPRLQDAAADASATADTQAVSPPAKPQFDSWEDQEASWGDVPLQPTLRMGCHSLVELELCVPFVNNDVLSVLTSSLLGLRRLSLVRCLKPATSGEVLASHLPKLRCLQVLELIGCSWLSCTDIQVLLANLPMDPIVQNMRHRLVLRSLCLRDCGMEPKHWQLLASWIGAHRNPSDEIWVDYLQEVVELLHLGEVLQFTIEET